MTLVAADAKPVQDAPSRIVSVAVITAVGLNNDGRHSGAGLPPKLPKSRRVNAAKVHVPANMDFPAAHRSVRHVP